MSPRALVVCVIAGAGLLAAPAGAAVAATGNGGARYGQVPVRAVAPKAKAKPKRVSQQAVGGASPADPPPAPVSPVAPVTPAAPVAASVPGSVAVINADGTANAPADAPQEVQALIAAANQIAKLPYRYGGGHGSFTDTAYDCSGSVSFALHGADLLTSTLTSGGLETWGRTGRGHWITVYANADHTFLVVAGIRFDTSGQKQAGTRWQPAARDLEGFTVRHPPHL